MRVLGVDPGLGITGFSIMDTKRNQTHLSAYGTIKPKPKDSLPKRLNYLFEEMNKILDQFSPDVMAIEDAFYSKNVKSAMTLGQARGSLILAAAQADISVYEFAPRKVKMSVCGNGAASKEQVSYMVTQILKLKEPPKPMDVSDAMAVGLCYINQAKFI
ncbi:MAG: crossover junction endodeoxyribonuclease RuvC [Candidatus Marinimicrobia bacterium]|jgi:crossover junction endodeoxyribonuclease RuvC|nr:crossover junction endodeoxyribonuclease RuvC [Candidatus Neomarinimicrobiota bacterium]MBT4369316.1 crossover junction endodeoxyribonuclease RuvC [Candidatus Neomarinimicrobiota bacterium]MBT4662994.1 crossover junction endodeoxyribonuclease RuvC [Candidatus Neomarinimicrobiota bacterium]MBT4828292.1 crossover junction endodeoxyribonuclease RuvC [Candidatus Neomarinimicrobiota bacterium]MBT6516102.1 crossover junction endodeoxyribonuclease RuvC [Candidatus Neomarinimicrobiota bacterium]